MFMDELDAAEKRCELMRGSRAERSLIPVDSHAQLDTGYTGRPDTDMKKREVAERERRDAQLRAIIRSKK